MSDARRTFFATCAPGLEPLLHEEIRGLKLAKVERQVGGVRFEGSLADAARANLWLRTAGRVLMHVARFDAADDGALYAGARTVPWKRYLGPERTFVIDAHCKDSALDHSLFVEQRVKDAIVDDFRERGLARPSVDKEAPDLGVFVHLVKDRCTLLVDTTGEPLYKRGWRRYQGRAPLGESLAAALVMFSGWDRRAPLVDPFCGGGTILIEAALLARNVAPGSFRAGFALEKLPGHDPALVRRLRDEAARAVNAKSKLVLLGRDWDPATIDGARENAAAAGLDEAIEFEVGEASAWEPRRGWNAWIVTNPPYGTRIGSGGERLGGADDRGATERALEEGIRRFGALLAERCAGYHLALLTGNPRHAAALGLPGLSERALWNGALECRLLTGLVG